MHDIWADRILKYNDKYILYRLRICRLYYTHTHTQTLTHVLLDEYSHLYILYLTRSCINLRFAPVLTTSPRPTAFAVPFVYLYHDTRMRVICMYIIVYNIMQMRVEDLMYTFIQGCSSSTLTSIFILNNKSIQISIFGIIWKYILMYI